MRQRTVALCCGALGCLALGALCCELLGRRRLFLIGGTLATLSPAALALCFGVPAAADSPRALQVVTAASTVAYLVAYNTALAALGWVVVVEALPLPYRAFGFFPSEDKRLSGEPSRQRLVQKAARPSA